MFYLLILYAQDLLILYALLSLEIYCFVCLVYLILYIFALQEPLKNENTHLKGLLLMENFNFYDYNKLQGHGIYI